MEKDQKGLKNALKTSYEEHRELDLYQEDLEHYCEMFKQRGKGSDFCVITGILNVCGQLENRGVDSLDILIQTLRTRFGRYSYVNNLIGLLREYAGEVNKHTAQTLDRKDEKESVEFASRVYVRQSSRYEKIRGTLLGRILRY